MSLFKSKEEKTLDEIKKKKAQMDKLKEEIVKMGKLVLKDGKLTKVEDTPKEEAKIGTPAVMPDVPTSDAEIDEMVQQERLRRQGMATLVNTPQPPRSVPPQMSQDQYNALQRQQELYNYQQQIIQQQAMQNQAVNQAQAEAEQREYMRQQQELYQQQQMRQQPQPYQQPQRLPMIAVSIDMVNGTTITISVPGDKVDSFVEGLNIAIDNQSSFPINNKIINGRNIVSYTIE